VSPEFELGAYEALWARQETGLKSIAQAFGAHPGAIPSDFVPKAEIEKYSRAGLAAIRDAGIQHFGVRVHGTTDYPARLHDADHPVGLLYFQGNWELVNTWCFQSRNLKRLTRNTSIEVLKLAIPPVNDNVLGQLDCGAVPCLRALEPPAFSTGSMGRRVSMR
jgi:hypothetical protein